MARIKITVMEHKDTGLLAASSDDLQGFIVFAKTEDELTEKLAPAFTHFMSAVGNPVKNVAVRKESPAGFWPPVFIARGETDRAAA